MSPHLLRDAAAHACLPCQPRTAVVGPCHSPVSPFSLVLPPASPGFSFRACPSQIPAWDVFWMCGCFPPLAASVMRGGSTDCSMLLTLLSARKLCRGPHRPALVRPICAGFVLGWVRSVGGFLVICRCPCDAAMQNFSSSAWESFGSF